MIQGLYQKPPSLDKQVNANTRLLDLITNESLRQCLPQDLCEGLALEETEIFSHLKATMEAEKAILGGILLDPIAIERVRIILQDYAFSAKSHQIVYDGCVRLHNKGMHPDLQSVTMELSSFGQLEKVGGIEALALLVEKTISAINVDQYAELLIENAHKNPINRDGSLNLRAAQEIAGVIVREKSEAQAEILLEEVREHTGMSVTRWTKFIASTVRGAKKDRYREELRQILVIDDPLDQSDEIHEICEIYRVSERKVKQDLATLERQTYKGKKRGIRPAIDYDEIESNPVPFLIPGLLPKGQSILLSGLSGTGKTIFALDIVEALLEGEQIYDFKPVKPCKVLLLITDQPKWATMSYIRNKGIDTTNPNLMLWLRDDQNDDEGFTVNDLLELRKGLEDFRPDFIVADSLRTIICHPTGISENDVLVGSYVSKVIQECTRFGATLLMIHHDNKSTEQQGIAKASGSGDIPARFDIHWQIEAPLSSSHPGRNIKTGKTRSVMIDGRFNFDPDEFRFELEHWNIESPEISKALSNTMNRIHHVLGLNKKGLAIWQIQDILKRGAEVTVRTIRRCLAKMTEQLMIGRKKHPEHQRAFLYFLGKDHQEPPVPTTDTPPQATASIEQDEVSPTRILPPKATTEKQLPLALNEREVKEEIQRQFKEEFFTVTQIKKEDFLNKFKGYVPLEWVEDVISQMIESGRFEETNKLIKRSKQIRPKFKSGDQILYNGRYGVIDRPASHSSWWVRFNDSYFQKEVNEPELDFYQ